MAQPGLGDLAYAGFGIESEWGTKVARTDFIRIISETLKNNVPMAFPHGAGGAARRIQIEGTGFVDGDITAFMNFEGHGLILESLLGASTPAQQAATSAYLHTFTLVDQLPVGLSIEVDRDKKGYTYEGMVVTQAVFSQSLTDPLRVVYSFLGEAETSDSATAESFPSMLPVLDTQFSMELDDGSASITSWQMTINNNMTGADRANLGTTVIKEPVRSAERIITGSFVAEFDAETMYAKFLAKAAIKLEFMYAGAVIEDANTYELNFTLPTCYLTPNAPMNVDGPGPIIQSFSFEAMNEGSDELTLTLQNEQTTIP